MKFFCRCILGCFMQHAPPPSIEVSKVVEHEVQNHLSNAMDDPECGVFVHWGIEGSGKSIAAALLARKLKSEKGRSVLFLDHHSLTSPSIASVVQMFCMMLPSREKSFQSDPTKPPPMSIIVDDLDKAENWNDGEFRKTIVSLAKISSSGKRFNVLLLVSSSSRARELLNWDWRHIQLVGGPGCGIWRREHVSKLLGTDVDAEIVDLCSRACTPGFVVWSAKMPTIGRMRSNAERCALEWEKGLSELTTFCI